MTRYETLMRELLAEQRGERDVLVSFALRWSHPLWHRSTATSLEPKVVGYLAGQIAGRIARKQAFAA